MGVLFRVSRTSSPEIVFLNCCWATMTTPFNATNVPPWIPREFILDSGNDKCPTATRTLGFFAIFNSIAIAVFILFGSTRFRHVVSCGFIDKHKVWTFWSAFATVALNLAGCVLQAELVRRSGYKADFGQLIQMAAFRPRTSWLIGNFAHFSHRMGYQNGALDNAALEVFLSAISSAFVGRLVAKVFSTKSQLDTTYFNNKPMHKYWMIAIPGIVMLVSTGFEILWALLVLWRTAQTRGKAEAKDYNNMMWIVRSFAPVTCACSWMVWYSFLSSAEGAYCPGNNKYVDAVWMGMPVVVNVVRAFIDSVRR